MANMISTYLHSTSLHPPLRVVHSKLCRDTEHLTTVREPHHGPQTLTFSLYLRLRGFILGIEDCTEVRLRGVLHRREPRYSAHRAVHQFALQQVLG